MEEPGENCSVEEFVQYWERKSDIFSSNGDDDADTRSTSFKDHLQLVYKSPLDERQRLGLEFFESHGYYDSPGVNTVQSFLELTRFTTFWGSPTTIPASDQLDEDEEKLIEEECCWERQIASDGVRAIQRELGSIRSQLGGISEETQSQSSTPTPHQGYTVPRPQRIILPPYSSALLCLRRKSRPVLSSWSKRWFYLDFISQELRYYKRGFKKSPRGCIELSAIREVRSLSTTDFQIRYGVRNMLLRAENCEEKRMWVTLLEFGRHGSKSLPWHASESANMLLNCLGRTAQQSDDVIAA